MPLSVACFLLLFACLFNKQGIGGAVSQHVHDVLFPFQARLAPGRALCPRGASDSALLRPPLSGNLRALFVCMLWSFSSTFHFFTIRKPHEKTR